MLVFQAHNIPINSSCLQSLFQKYVTKYKVTGEGNPRQQVGRAT